MAIKVIVEDVRAFFPSLFEEETYQGQPTGSYGIKLYLEKSGANLKRVTEAVIAEAKATWPDDWQRMLAVFKGDVTKSCLSDGDLSEIAGYHGGIILGAKRKLSAGRPVVLDRNRTPLAEEDGRPYSGCYVNASVEIWAQNKKYKGIRCALLGVQFYRDGDAFAGGAMPSEDDFSDLTVGEGSNVTPLNGARPVGGASEVGALY